MGDFMFFYLVYNELVLFLIQGYIFKKLSASRDVLHIQKYREQTGGY